MDYFKFNMLYDSMFKKIVKHSKVSHIKCQLLPLYSWMDFG